MFGAAEFVKLYDILSGYMIDVDCGERCGKYCCGHGYMAKYLLPGEKAHLVEQGIESTVIFVESAHITGYRGRHDPSCACDTIRDIRPFCCRMFPFRPVIDNAQVVGLVKATGDRLAPCWIEKPLPPWEQAAIEAWRYVLSDRANLEFFAKISILYEMATSDELRPDWSPLAILASLGERPADELMVECARFFGRTT
jgi:hypothetical protein